MKGNMRKIIIVIALVLLSVVGTSAQSPAPTILDQKITCAGIVKKNEKGLLPYWSHDEESDVRTFSHWDDKNQICFEIQTYDIHGKKPADDGNTSDGYDLFIIDAIEGTRYVTSISAWKHTSTSDTERHSLWVGIMDINGKYWDSFPRKDFYYTELAEKVFQTLGIKLE